MTATAFLFPGQGSQVVGMAKALAERYIGAAAAMREADEVLGYRLSSLCFEGPEETLTDTENAQPALLAASVAALRAIHEALPGMAPPAAVAGHSMGQYSALVAASSISYSDGLILVRERGQLMKEAGQLSPGGMAAILGLDAAEVVALCAQAADLSGGVVQMANDNCPGQTVISGDNQSLELAMDLARQAGAKKVVRLAVSIAAHSPLMEPVADRLRRAIDITPVRKPSMPVIGNVHAQPLLTTADIRYDLASQLTSPVRWTESMQHLAGRGIELVVEVGSGDVLTNLMKRIDRNVQRVAVGEPDGLERLRALVKD